jgi:nitrogen fixation protein NifU and related proteins
MGTTNPCTRGLQEARLPYPFDCGCPLLPGFGRSGIDTYNIPVYSAQLLDHFEHPRNAGVLENPHASVQLENPACGDILKLTALLKDGVIDEIRFQAKGCVPTIASGSALTELIRNKTIAQASAVTRSQLIDELGALPPASGHAAQLAIDALTDLLAALRTPGPSHSQPR